MTVTKADHGAGASSWPESKETRLDRGLDAPATPEAESAHLLETRFVFSLRAFFALAFDWLIFITGYSHRSILPLVSPCLSRPRGWEGSLMGGFRAPLRKGACQIKDIVIT